MLSSLPVSVKRPSSAFMKMRKSRGDSALPCATPVSKTIVALEASFGDSRTVELSYSPRSKSTSGIPYASMTCHRAA